MLNSNSETSPLDPKNRDLGASYNKSKRHPGFLALIADCILNND